MRLLGTVSEHEMVAVFLKTEIASARFQGAILELLRRDGRDRSVVEHPDTTSEAENRYRLRLLGDFRGYRQNRDLFDGFPDDVAWHRAALTPGEVARVKYIAYDYWEVLSGGSRLPADAAPRIRAGIVVFGQKTEGFLALAQALREGATFPPLILVGTRPGADLVVLEGHARLTAYLLAPECIPPELEVIAGFSPRMACWGLY